MFANVEEIEKMKATMGAAADHTIVNDVELALDRIQKLKDTSIVFVLDNTGKSSLVN